MINRPSRRTVLTTAAILTGASAAGAALLSAGAGTQYRWPAAGLGAILGLIVGSGFATYLPLTRRLGRFTAIAALSVAFAAILGGVAAIAPTCPGGTNRCSGSEIGSWLLSGALLPIAWAALILPALFLLRAVIGAGRRLRTLTRTGTGGTGNSSTGTAARSTGSTRTWRERTRRTKKNRPGADRTAKTTTAAAANSH